jgi:hypothetical protein
MITEIIQGCGCCQQFTGRDLDTALVYKEWRNGYSCVAGPSPNRVIWSGDNTSSGGSETFYVRNLSSSAQEKFDLYFGWYNTNPEGTIIVSYALTQSASGELFLLITLDWGSGNIKLPSIADGTKMVTYLTYERYSVETHDHQGGCATNSPKKATITFENLSASIQWYIPYQKIENIQQ